MCHHRGGLFMAHTNALDAFLDAHPFACSHWATQQKEHGV
jgi:hypothetical protein